MITIATSLRLKQLYFCDNFHEKINFVDNSSKDADLYFTQVQWHTYDSNKVKPNEVSFLANYRKYVDRKLLRCREGFCVDNRILPRSDFNNFCFTGEDFCDIPYVIPAPCGPLFGDNKTIKNETFHNKVFWSGGITHETRANVLSFYNKVDDKRFNVSLFKDRPKRIYAGGLKTETYETYLNNLSKSDVVYLLRGDRIWTYTFYDIIRAGCIPVMISSMNDYGWENIFTNVDDYVLRFDLREHSMEYIHQQVALLLEDKERVLYMKNNIRKFHDMFFKHNCAAYGFSELLLAKLLEIYKNDFDINKIDDKFICPEILNLKGLSGKL
jgi:hypothetical protein